MDDKASKKILIVEDDQFLREFYQELLAGEGYNVDIAEDGEIAEAKIKTISYKLILLDIMLPKKDGVQILEDIRKNPVSNLGQIIVLTNLGQDEIIKKCFELGAAGYMIKSALNPEQVLEEIRNYVKASES